MASVVAAGSRRGQRGGSISPLEDYADWVFALVGERPDWTLEEFVAALRKQRMPAAAARSGVFERHDISFKKKPARG